MPPEGTPPVAPVAVPEDRPRPPRRAPRWRAHLLAEGLIVLAIVGWYLLSLTLPSYILPGPLQVAEATARIFYDPDLLGHMFSSLGRLLLAVVLAVFLGGLIALLPTWLPWTRIIVHERIKPLLNSFPSLGWAILAAVWFGPSNETIVFVEVAILTPFCLVNISEGLRELDKELLEMGTSFTRNRRKIFWKITVPLLMPYVVSAVRIAYGVGWKIAIVAELFGVESGLGFVMERARTLSDASTVFGVCFAIVLLFFAGEKLVIDPLARRFQKG